MGPTTKALQHLPTHGDYSCEQCGMHFPKYTGLERHQKQVTLCFNFGKPTQCPSVANPGFRLIEL